MADSKPLLSNIKEKDSDEVQYQIERICRLPLYEFRSVEHLKKIIFWSYFPECLSLPLFYYLGTQHMSKTSQGLQGLFLAGSSYLQLSAFKYMCTEATSVDSDRKFSSIHENAKMSLSLLEPLNAIMGLPVKFLGLRKWNFDLLALAPNYLNVIATVQAVAAVEHEWTPYEEVFRRRWSNVAVVGHFVGEAGLPTILKYSVVANMGFHFLFLVSGSTTDNKDSMSMTAEAANLLFLEKATNVDGLHTVRTLVAPVVKVPMIWMKISLLALMYNNLDSSGVQSLLVAIFLAFYGLVPLLPGLGFMMWVVVSDIMPRACRECRGGVPDSRREICLYSMILMSLISFCVLLVIVLSHLAGVFFCSSHDLSILHGCTIPMNVSNVSV